MGYRVTGIDASEEMIRFPRERSACAFIVADIRDISAHESFDAALCMYDSLNHFMRLEDLQRALVAIR